MTSGSGQRDRRVAAGAAARGFSLIELVVSLAIVSIVMGSIVSAIMLAARAIPRGDDPSLTTPLTTRLLNELMEDLRYAVHFTERTDRSATWTVPDRDGDGMPEIIRYAWSPGVRGSAGPLTRQYNDGPVVELAGAVRDFELTYEVHGIKETYPGPIVERPMMEVLASHTSANQNQSVEGSTWVGQSLPAASLSLDSDAVAWRPARAGVFVMGRRGLLGLPIAVTVDVQVQIQSVADDQIFPAGDVLTQQRLYDSSILSLGGTWKYVDFPSDAPRIDRGRATALAITRRPGRSGAVVGYHGATTAAGYLETNQGDNGWQRRPNRSVTYGLWGYQSIQTPDQHLTRHYVTAVGLSLQLGSDAALRPTTAVELLNTPQLIDLGWAASGMTPGTTVTSPRHNFDQPTTVRLRLRNDGEEAATFRINADWGNDGRCAPLYAALSTDPESNDQKIVIGCGDTVLMTRTGLANGAQDVRLLIDPTKTPGTVNVQINGEERGSTYQYARVSVAHDQRHAMLESGPHSQWMLGSIRVGGTP